MNIAQIIGKKKPIDGFYVDEYDQNNVAIEFLGDHYHGHPSLWGENQEKCDQHSRLFKDLFVNTEKKLSKLKSLGYKVFYVWECDFKKNGPLNTIEICREFDNKLYW